MMKTFKIVTKVHAVEYREYNVLAKDIEEARRIVSNGESVPDIGEGSFYSYPEIIEETEIK